MRKNQPTCRAHRFTKFCQHNRNKFVKAELPRQQRTNKFFNSYHIIAFIKILKPFKMTESTHISLHLYIKVSEENQKQIKIAQIRTEEAIITGFFIIRSNRNNERVNVLNHVLAFGRACFSRLNFKQHQTMLTPTTSSSKHQLFWHWCSLCNFSHVKPCTYSFFSVEHLCQSFTLFLFTFRNRLLQFQLHKTLSFKPRVLTSF